MSSDYQPQTEKKIEWCGHLTVSAKDALIQEEGGGYSGKYPIKFCPMCAKPRPEERDELDEIMDKWWPLEFGTHKQLIKKDLRAWKEKDSISKMAQNVLESEGIIDKEMFRKEEKPKLWELLQRTFNGNRHTTDTWNPEWKGTALGAVEAVERVIDKVWYDEFLTMRSPDVLKKKLRSELL